MTDSKLEALRYPKGRLSIPETITAKDVEQWIDAIEAAPAKYRAALEGLSDAQLDSSYRPEGWTIRQVMHHVCDSHLNSYIRFKWTLTEEKPTIKTYNEKSWAEIKEAKTEPVDVSLNLLESLHRRWVIMLRNISPEEWERTFIHPEHGKEFNLKWLVALYAWHSAHHLGHIELVANA